MGSNISMSKSIHMTSVWNLVMLLIKKYPTKSVSLVRKLHFPKLQHFKSGKSKGDSTISRGVSSESQQK